VAARRKGEFYRGAEDVRAPVVNVSEGGGSEVQEKKRNQYR